MFFECPHKERENPAASAAGFLCFKKLLCEGIPVFLFLGNITAVIADSIVKPFK